MSRLLLILVCLALFGCVPVETVQTGAGEDMPAEPQVDVQTIVEEINLTPSAGGQVEIIGGDEQTLREFIQRYFGRVYPGAPAQQTRILIGSLPDDLKIDLPIPEGARVVATLEEHSTFTQIILDTPMIPDEVETFYTQSLTDLGWQTAPQGDQGSGFVSSVQMGERFCLNENEAYLEVSSVETADGPTDVRLNLQAPVEFYPCQEYDPGYMDPGTKLIPSLEAPDGVQIPSSGAGSSSDGSAYNTADLETDLSIDELLAYYNSQLEQAGWELVDQGTSEVVAWSAWKLIDEKGDEWGGNLIMMDNHLDSDRRFAIVSVEKVD
jgi:hypothetical protein